MEAVGTPLADVVAEARKLVADGGVFHIKTDHPGYFDWMCEAIDQVKVGVRGGSGVSAPLGQTGVFPPLALQMISVGEATGAMDTMLSKIADFYEDETDQAVEALTAMMEPMIMVVLGTLIGGMVVAMYLPIFKMGQAV